MTKRDAALRYAGMGLSVIPLKYQGSADEVKRPLVPWDAYKQQAASVEQVEQWWRQHPDANVGIVMGAVSGLVAIDCDGPASLRLLEERFWAMPPTPWVKTGKGHHLIFQHPGRPVPNRVRLASDADGNGIDVRGDGGYIVAPPSVHGTGAVYTWIGQEHVSAPLPETLLAAIEGRSGDGGSVVSDSAWVDQVLGGVPEGERNATAARMAGYWLAVTDGNEVAAWQALRAWNLGCRPPLPERELQHVFSSICKRDRQDPEDPRQPAKVYAGSCLADELRDSPPRQGIKLGMVGIDHLGGLVGGDLVVLAGRPGKGKSTYAAQLAAEAAFNLKVPAFVASTEMTRQQWGIWMTAYHFRRETHAIPRPIPDDMLRPWRESPIYICDQGAISAEQIAKEVRALPNIKLVVVDHIGRLTTRARESRTQEVGDSARTLKSLAKDLGCTVLCLCQLNRNLEIENRRPRLSDLRESGEIEQEADSVLFLWSDAGQFNQQLAKLPVELIIEKNRHGPLFTFNLMFDKPLRRFYESSETGGR